MNQSRGLASLSDIVRSLLGYRVAGPVDYLALYPGRVAAQSADKTRVDVVLDSDRIPSPSNIPLRLGIPGTTTQINTASTVRVLVGWEGGNPAKPYAVLFDPGAATLQLNVSASTLIAINGGASLTLDATLITISGDPIVDINGTSITCGPVGSIPVLVQGSFDSMGVPVQQLPACTNALKAG